MTKTPLIQQVENTYQERIEFLIPKLYRKLGSLRRVADKIQVHPNTLKAWAKQLNLTRNKPNARAKKINPDFVFSVDPLRCWTPTCDMVLSQFVAEGYTPAKIAKLLRRTEETVAKRITYLEEKGLLRYYAGHKQVKKTQRLYC